MSDADTIDALREQIAGLREGRAVHAEKLQSMDLRLCELSADVKKILTYMERNKGSWKVLVTLGTVSTALVEGAHQIVAWLHHSQ